MSANSVKGWRHLVNAYEGKAGMVQFAGKTVWPMSERFEIMRSINGAI